LIGYHSEFEKETKKKQKGNKKETKKKQTKINE